MAYVYSKSRIRSHMRRYLETHQANIEVLIDRVRVRGGIVAPSSKQGVFVIEPDVEIKKLDTNIHIELPYSLYELGEVSGKRMFGRNDIEGPPTFLFRPLRPGTKEDTIMKHLDGYYADIFFMER